MCEALPGPRCSNHATKRMMANRVKTQKSREKLKEIDLAIDEATNECDMSKVGALLEERKVEEERYQELASKDIEFTEAWYTTEQGSSFLEKKIEQETDPKRKATLMFTRERAIATKEKQRYSKQLYDTAKSTPTEVVDRRVSQMKQAQVEYMNAYRKGENIDKAERRFRMAKDRILLAQAGDTESFGVTPMSISQAANYDFSEKPCYIRVPQDKLVDDHGKYFPYGNPLERVKSIDKEDVGVSVTTGNNQIIRVGEVWVPFKLNE